MIKNLFLIGLGGAIGSMVRYAGYLLITNKNFPVATLVVNIIGSFIIGVILAYCAKNQIFSTHWKLFLTTGICGGFTTFSAFSAENISLLQNGKIFVAAVYIVLSLVLSIAAAWLGFKIIGNSF